MKKYNVSLTKEEIDALQIALCASKIDLEKDIERLENYNETGINTKNIAQKRERIKECDELFTKLYDATKNQ